MFRRLRNNMLVFNMLTVSLVMALAFSTVYFVNWANARRTTQDQLTSMIVSSSAMGRMRMGGRGPMAAGMFQPTLGMSFIVTTSGGAIESVASRVDFDESVYEEAIRQVAAHSTGEVEVAGHRWAFQKVTWSDTGEGAYERISFVDITESKHLLQNLRYTLLGVGAVMLLAIYYLSRRFAERAVAPIQESYEQQQRFVADASHELRTPLAVIGANIDAIESSPGETVESQSQWFGYVKSELARTGKLVDDLLYLARSEGDVADEVGPFNLSRTAEAAGASMEALLHERGVEFSSEVADGIVVRGDGERLAQVVYILLDNAAKYTPEGGTVSLALARESGSAVLRVANTGNGIAREDLPRIFDRFYRPDDSRTSATGGTGLGLSIALAIVGNSGGSIGAESADGLTTFTVRLRLA